MGILAGDNALLRVHRICEGIQEDTKGGEDESHSSGECFGNCLVLSRVAASFFRVTSAKHTDRTTIRDNFHGRISTRRSPSSARVSHMRKLRGSWTPLYEESTHNSLQLRNGLWTGYLWNDVVTNSRVYSRRGMTHKSLTLIFEVTVINPAV